MKSQLPFIHPYQKLRQLSNHSKQLFVVSYVNQTGIDKHGRPMGKSLSDSTTIQYEIQTPLQKTVDQLTEEAIADIKAASENGADGVVFINEWASLSEFEAVLANVCPLFPSVNLGVNYLGDFYGPDEDGRMSTTKDGYGYKDSFRLADRFNLKIVWTDFSGVDEIKERSNADLHEIELFRRGNELHRKMFYASGIHMKYSTLMDVSKTIEESALQAMGFTDGIIITGPATGIPCDPELAKRVRAVVGNYPIGVASGVSAENVESLMPYVDFYLVASSLQDSNKRIVGEKVKKLRKKMS